MQRHPLKLGSGERWPNAFKLRAVCIIDDVLHTCTLFALGLKINKCDSLIEFPFFVAIYF